VGDASEVSVKDYTWFTLLIRAIGILIVGVAISPSLAWVGYIIGALREGRNAPGIGEFWSLSAVFGAMATCAQLAYGLYLIFGARWLIVHCIGSLYGRCHACGYDLTGVVADRCPECGVPFPTPLKSPAPVTGAAPGAPPP
jgi:hypothetical protein